MVQQFRFCFIGIQELKVFHVGFVVDKLTLVQVSP
jgi:hypothetical protein